jgi:cell wall-associated NlpC family hydrolase
MTSKFDQKKITNAVLGLFFACSVAVLALPGANDTVQTAATCLDYSEKMAQTSEISQFPSYTIAEEPIEEAEIQSETIMMAQISLDEEEEFLPPSRGVSNRSLDMPPVVSMGEVKAAAANEPAATQPATKDPVSTQTQKTAAEAKPVVKTYNLPSADQEPSSYRYVNANSLNVRKGPGTEYDKITNLSRGEKVGVYKTDGEWTIIKTAKGSVGCVFTSYLVADEKSVERPETAQGSEVTTLAQQIVDYSKTLQGIKYVYGGYSTKGFDCSGFTKYVYAHFGITVPRSSSQYVSFGKKVAREDLRASDILLFDTDNNGTCGHVGIYLGNDKFIHASTSKGKVIIMTLSEYRGKYIGARRVID